MSSNSATTDNASLHTERIVSLHRNTLFLRRDATTPWAIKNVPLFWTITPAFLDEFQHFVHQ